MAHTVITIGREYGSGGRIVAKQVAEKLGIPFYDKSLIAMAAAETGLSEDYIRESEQKKTSSFLYSLAIGAQSLPVADQVFIAQSDVIRRVAAEGPCVIVGRCADYVLREYPGRLNVFIHAPLAERVRRAVEEYHVDAPDPRAYVVKQDKCRAAYYEHFTDAPWGRVNGCDLAVNTRLGLETAERLILTLAAERGINP